MATATQVSQDAKLGGAGATAIVASWLGPAAAAGPIGIAIGGAVLAITALSGQIAHLISGCGDQCTAATQVVNQADVIVQQIASAYWQAPTRTKSFQAWTLAQMDDIFNQVRTLCGKIGGDPGQRCVQERLQRGFRPPWCTDSSVPLSQCGGWYDVTYDPIARDPAVIPDPVPLDSVTGGLKSLFGSGSGGGYLVPLVAGLGVFAFVAYKVRTA
jgi:hypothetical protein